MNFKKFIIGLAIFIVTIIFIVFVNRAINPKPSYQDCYPSSNKYMEQEEYKMYYNDCYSSYNEALKLHKEKSFFIVTLLSVLAIIAGVLVRTVAPISWGLIMAGLMTLIYVFFANFEEIGKPYRAIISGIALVVLIGLAYARLGDREKITSNPSEANTKTDNTS